MDSFKLRTTEDLKKAQEEKVHQKLLETERARSSHEKYEIKEIGGWMMWGPFLGFLVTAIAGLMIWLSGESDTSWLWWIAGISITPMILFGVASDLDTQWKAALKAKAEIGRENLSKQLSHEFIYKYDYLYTDNAALYQLYKVAKFICGLSTIVFGALVAILLFMWLGTISIAPTTIIIVLLVMILLKEK